MMIDEMSSIYGSVMSVLMVIAHYVHTSLHYVACVNTSLNR